MSTSDADKWNSRYQQRSNPNPPAEVLLDNRHLLSKSGKALELACGLGGNSLFLAELGYSVTAMDVSSVAIERLKELSSKPMFHVKPIAEDLEDWQAPFEEFDLVIVTSYYQESLFEQIKFCLKPGGLIFYQTFTQLKVGNEGPSNPKFLLAKGELLSQFSEYDLVNYCDNADIGDPQNGLRNQSYIVARKPIIS